MKIFTTISGSIYQVDFENKQIRRLTGNALPTDRQGQDGEWKKYTDIVPNPIAIGSSVIIVWAGDMKPVDPNPDNLPWTPTTMTSFVTEVSEVQ